MNHTSTRSQYTVWIIDDDETALLLAEEVLTQAGFQVRTFTNAPSALTAAHIKLPDIIVVDVIMPGMSGFEFCTELRRLPRGAVVPILVTTSLDDTAAIDKAYQAGATNFATKPLNWAIEIYRLDYLLRSSRIALDLLQKEHETRLAKEDWERTFNSITDGVTVLGADLKILRANHAARQAFNPGSVGTGNFPGVGSTGNLPVPLGHRPNGTEGIPATQTDVQEIPAPPPRPSGGLAAAISEFGLGRPPETIIGRVCHELLNPGAGPCPDCPVPRVLATNQSAVAEIKCGNGAGGLFEISVSPVANSQGRITHLVHVARDLTEKKELEAGLRQAQKMEAIGTLAGGIAHDFNNLMMVVQGCAELLLQEDADAAAGASRNREDLDAILEAAKRGARLTKQLLLFSRKQSSSSQKRPLNLNELLTNVMQMLEKGLSKSVGHQFRLAADLRPINADSVQLEQVVMNLAVNAAHAMPAGGTLTIATQNVRFESAAGQAAQPNPGLAPGEYVLLSVSDTGTGMDQTTMAHIYEPFFTTKRVGEGSGLGLAVVFGIVREHKGQIACNSEVGVGTTFRIYFPAIRQTAPAPPVGRVPSPGGPETPVGRVPSRGGSETILVVDDEATIRELLQRHLTRQGYSIVTAADGQIALRQYTQSMQAGQRPQAVILDLGMPNMSGWECLEKLRALDPLAKVLIASGYGVAELDTNALKAGACAFLGKPYDLAIISRKLREILDAPRPPAINPLIA